MQVGAFTIVCPLGDGPRGSMYLAEHPVLGTRRAVRVLLPPRADDPRWVQRFVDAARTAARVAHRNLVQVHDVGPLAGGGWFMLLDHVDGGTLDPLIASPTGPIAPERVAHLVGEIAGALQAAHDHGIVHGRLTPEQIGLRGTEVDPRVVAPAVPPVQAVRLDLTAAWLDDEPAAGPALPYRAPEQLRGAPPGPTADVFALGVIAYRMTTGGWFPHPYGDGAGSAPPVDPRERVPGLPAAWAEAIVAALAPDPARRPPDPRAFARGLAEAVTGPAAPPASEPGARYQLGDRLGGGGMAEVFAATMAGAEGFTRRVAVKRVLPELSRVPAFAAMFVAEAQIASRLAHPNIVSVLDFTRDAEGRLSLVMEHIDGKDLASLLVTGAIGPALASFVVTEILRGLAYAHDLPGSAASHGGGTVLGVVHRDISPQNVLLSYQGEVKISDFGLAKLRAASGAVRSDVVRGKPSYMSPEQIAGDRLDGRSDLYAAGVMLWEMLADRPLFTGTVREIAVQMQFRDIARPGSFRTDVPPDVEAVAMTLLARDRTARFATAQAAIDALLACGVLRDGRGDLADLLVARFPGTAGTHGSRDRSARAQPAGGAGAASAPRGGPGDPLTVTAPPSGEAPAQPDSRGARAGSPRRRVFAATLGLVMLAGLAAGVLARGEIAPRTVERVAPGPSRSAAPLARAPEPAPAPPEPAPPAGTVHGEVAPAAAPPAPPRVPRHERTEAVDRPDRPARAARGDRTDRPGAAGRTGELAIIVRPWAMIWLNGKPSGQTPFRSVVPAGRYRVRIVNEDAGRDEQTTVTVEPDRTATVERSW